MTARLAVEFSSLEAAILGYLYDHPEGVIATTSLTGILKSEESAIQYGIESLIAARLVAGDRFSKSGKVQYAKLRLTTKGQSEAIKEKRRTKSIIFNVLTLGPTTSKFPVQAEEPSDVVHDWISVVTHFER